MEENLIEIIGFILILLFGVIAWFFKRLVKQYDENNKIVGDLVLSVSLKNKDYDNNIEDLSQNITTITSDINTVKTDMNTIKTDMENLSSDFNKHLRNYHNEKS